MHRQHVTLSYRNLFSLYIFFMKFSYDLSSNIFVGVTSNFEKFSTQTLRQIRRHAIHTFNSDRIPFIRPISILYFDCTLYRQHIFKVKKMGAQEYVLWLKASRDYHVTYSSTYFRYQGFSHGVLLANIYFFTVIRCIDGLLCNGTWKQFKIFNINIYISENSQYQQWCHYGDAAL